MTNLRTAAMIAVAIGASPVVANAGDPACAAPPYGSSLADYKAFINSFGMLIWQSEARAQVFLAAICEAKLSHAPDKLDALHRVGISDDEVDIMTMSDLRLLYLRELRERIRAVP